MIIMFHAMCQFWQENYLSESKSENVRDMTKITYYIRWLAGQNLVR